MFVDELLNIRHDRFRRSAFVNTERCAYGGFIRPEPLMECLVQLRAGRIRRIQRYYALEKPAYHPEVFEPHVQPEDLSWHAGERVLASLAPSLAFWEDSQYLGLIHDGEIVSCNVLDVALSYCNHLPFSDRIVHFVRDNLWHELMVRYLHQENLEAAVHRQLSLDLGEPLALAVEPSYNET